MGSDGTGYDGMAAQSILKISLQDLLQLDWNNSGFNDWN